MAAMEYVIFSDIYYLLFIIYYITCYRSCTKLGYYSQPANVLDMVVRFVEGKPYSD